MPSYLSSPCFSLSQTRSRSLIFSKQAIIKRIHGQWCFVFQVCELRKHQLVESRISCYCVQKTINDASGVPFQMTHMQLSVRFLASFHLQHPSSQNQGSLVLMLPAFVVLPAGISHLVPPHRCAVAAVPRLRACGAPRDRELGRPFERADFALFHVVAHRRDASERAQIGRV